MANNRILWTYIAADLLFVISGGLILIFALTTKVGSKEVHTISNVAKDLLLDTCPLSAAIGNSVLIFVTFLISVPGIILPTTRGWLKLSGYMAVVCGLFTMILGLSIWYETLKTRSVLSDIWDAQPQSSQSLLQQAFNCCGYQNSTSFPLVIDSACPNPLVAATQVGCVDPFSKFANNFLDVIFTSAFGIVGIDVLLVLSTAILLKDRKEKERYRHIDEKNGTGSF